jgi:hypothetical protein
MVRQQGAAARTLRRMSQPTHKKLPGAGMPDGRTADFAGTAPRSEQQPQLIHVTFFDDEYAKTLDAEDISLWNLRDLILKTTASTKASLPWLKLATFGNRTTAKGSLRHDDNVIAISGKTFKCAKRGGLLRGEAGDE